jgi:membrane-bound metal-dependent hydrolase YbcI (DUF457 family)
MDTITHGVAGALISKALFGGEDLFSRQNMNRGRVVTWATMLAAIFPDSDILRDWFSRNDLLIVTWHRSITHSLLCLPIFAVLLALVTQWFARWRKWETPPLPVLIGIYAAGIFSHIFLDLVTTFGTMIWSPIEWSRPAWDLLFIVDFSFTGILLVPQLLEWVNRDALHAKRRALMMWVIFVPSPFLIAAIGRLVGAPISDTAVIAACLLFSLLFLMPAFRGWGARIKPVTWNRGGLVVGCVYLGLAFCAHYAALERVKSFIALEQIRPEVYGALPYPPSLLHWDGLVRTSRGVYNLPIDLSKRNSFAPAANTAPADPGAPVIEYKYSPDAPSNLWIARAKRLPEVEKVLWFARFPLTQFRVENGQPVVDISDLRFPRMRPDRPGGFTYRVRFDSEGNVVSQGWLRR